MEWQVQELQGSGLPKIIEIRLEEHEDVCLEYAWQVISHFKNH